MRRRLLAALLLLPLGAAGAAAQIEFELGGAGGQSAAVEPAAAT